MRYTKEQAKEKIKELVEKYEKVVSSSKINDYTEEDTKKGFIDPLFKALGWDTEDKEEVSNEEKASKGRVDYAFKLNGINKFFVEAKPLKTDLGDPKLSEQAVNYAWHRAVSYAVLTNFEGLRIFNAEWKWGNILQSQLFPHIPYDQFLEKFDKLWFLSKESFENGELDTWAEDWGKKTKKEKLSVQQQILTDLMKWRESLARNIALRNQDRLISPEELDETVQRIIDRLIFIRMCEDRDIEEKLLISNLRDWEEHQKKDFVEILRDLFQFYLDNYDEKLFQPHLCDDIKIDDGILSEIIKGLYKTKDKNIQYDFSAIDADVLGNIYEQYLSYVIKKTVKRATVDESTSHKKEQGIYYTPTYIVDYIVKNTIGELLKDNKVNPEKIRILDPACGSGSFLIKSFDFLCNYYKEKEGVSELDFEKKQKVLSENIFGVDLDPKAVEISQLNLLLKTTAQRHKLLSLNKNIRCGNSLIDDTEVAGKSAFKWEEEFKQIMDEGGFDVVIGNPPYVNIFNLQEKDRLYFQEHYETATNKSDLYAFFIEKIIKNLLKENGYLGFIISNTWTSIQSFEKLRKLLLECTVIERIVPLQLGVFADATVVPIIIIVRKTNNKKEISKNNVKIFNLQNQSYILEKELPQEYFLNTKGHVISFSFNIADKSIFEKIQSKSILLGDIAKFSLGIKTADNDKFVLLNKKDEFSHKVLKGKYIKRYSLEYHGEWIWYKPEEMMKRKGAGPRKKEIFEGPKKIILQEISGDKIAATLDKEKFYSLDTTNILYELKSDYELEYILGLLNSKLINFWYGTQFKGLHVKLNELRQIPVKIAFKTKQQIIVNLVNNMLSLNHRLSELGDKKTDERVKIEEEIKEIDAEIDELVYKLYGINENEKKIIEESLGQK